MAVTNGWGKATQNNTNGYGKYQNTIGAASVYAVSAAGETVIEGASAAFTYAKSSYHQGESDPTPTITGTAGGTFSATSGLVFVDSGTNSGSSTGQIDLSASTIQANTITYTVSGVSENFSLSVTAVPFTNTYSMEFDGVDEFFNTNGPNFTGAFSFSGWFKTTSTATQSIWAAVDSTTNKHFLRLSGGSAIRVKLFDASGGNANTDNTTTYNDGNWHHIAFTTDGLTTSNGIKVYLDGSLLSTQGTLSNAGFISTNKNNIGGYNSSTWLFNGNLDELALFNGVLSSSAITEIYNSGTPNSLNSLSNASGPISWYRMGENATFSNPGGVGNWTLTDQGSGGNNATSNNMEELDRKTDTP